MRTINVSDEGGAVSTAIRANVGMRRRRIALTASSNSEKRQRTTASPASRSKSDSSSDQSPNSKRRFPRPRNVKGLAAQVSDLATRILNGELDANELDQARIYASLARTAAQLISSEVSRARYLREEPDLSLDQDDPMPEPEIEGDEVQPPVEEG